MYQRIASLPALLLIATVLVATDHSIAQNISEENFTLYTKDQGLSSNIITGVAQDSTGYIWTSTSFGLNRFNGSNFLQFHAGDDSSSLPSENIKGLVWIDKYHLCAYGDGVHIINTRTGERQNLFIPYSNKQYQYKFNWIMSVNSNAAGDIFILTRSGFYHFNKDHHLVFRFDYYTAEEVATTVFVFGKYTLPLDEKGLAIVSSKGIYYYNTEKKIFKRMDSADCPLFAEFLDFPKRDLQFFTYKEGRILILKPNGDSAVYIDISKNEKKFTQIPFKEFDYHSKILQFNDTALYITGKASGFYKLTISASGAIRFFPEKYLPFYSCRQLLPDRDNNLWIATNEGLLHQHYIQKPVRQVSVPMALQKLFPNIVIDDLYAVKDKIYAATRGNAGILVFDKNSLKFMGSISFEKYRRHPDNIYSITSLNENTLLVGTNGPLFELNIESGVVKEIPLDYWNKEGGWIGDLYKDKKKNIWIATDSIYKYEPATGKYLLIPAVPKDLNRIERAQSIEEDASGNIWFAGHGLVRYNVTKNTFDKLIDSFPFMKMPDRQVNTFIIDHQNNLWINTNNNGLVYYNTQTKTSRLLTRDNGLPENNIASMIIIRDKLWMATFEGIACLDLKTFQISSFGKEDGFPEQPIPIGSKFFYDSAQDKLYIGFTNTLVQLDPDIISLKSKAPDLFIESVTANDQKKIILPGKSFTTLWRNNEITVNIGSINFFTSKSQRFAYCLVKGDSSRWQQLGFQNTFSISNLSPGNHRIQVKLFSVNNQWPEQIKEFDVIVLPPLWQQTWFIIVLVILLGMFIYLFIQWRTNLIRKKEREKTNMARLKAEEYKNQFELEQITNYFSSSLSGIKNVDEVLWDVSKNLIGRMNYEDCMIYMWNEEKTKMIQKASYGPKGDPKAISNSWFDVLPGQGVVGYVIQTKEPLIIRDTRKDSRYRLDDIMRLSEICVPIVQDGELIGIIDSEHHEVSHFNERDIKILTTIATLVANKIKQIESEQSLIIKQNEIAFINQQLAEAQLLALQTQMNPHFIFNSLNSIKGMILDNEQQRASRYMSKFANMLRITLNQSKEVFTTLDENMEHLENYLAMEKLRFDDSFTFRITADDNIDKEDTLVPTMMIQPLAENAVWHGLMPKKGKKKLLIHFSRTGEKISCIVEDNGIGINHSERLKQLNRPLHKSVGLSNLQNRIKILNEKYDTGCSLKLFDLQDFDIGRTGSCALLTFRIINNKPV